MVTLCTSAALTDQFGGRHVGIRADPAATCPGVYQPLPETKLPILRNVPGSSNRVGAVIIAGEGLTARLMMQCGCCHKLGVFFAGVPRIRALLFGVYIRAPDLLTTLM